MIICSSVVLFVWHPSMPCIDRSAISVFGMQIMQIRKAKFMYDYIIVGAGSAGCVLANRLTADPESSVLLLEAGGNDDLATIHDPTPTAAITLLQSAVDWAYSTEAEPHLNNRKVFWPRGKVLGGSSSINFMVYARGHRHAYNHWQALENEGWSYADVLPYFKKAENWEYGASEYRSTGGPLNVIRPSSSNPLTEAFINAGEELGWLHNDDYNGASQEGFGTLQYTVHEGKRNSTAVSYLHPAESRPNLTVKTGILVTRVLFESTRAIGVAYLQDGVEQQEWVKKEVILSGGAINSPQLLLLSGVGPADQLRALNIRVVADVPGVGKNLQDHPSVFMYATTKPSFSQFGSLPEGIAFVRTQSYLLEPDIQLLMVPSFFPNTVQGAGYTIVPVLVSPQSRGHLTLRSTDPTQYPAIFANYFANQADLQTLVRGVKLTRELSQSKAFAPFYERGADPSSQIQSDWEIVEYLRNTVQTLFHPAGTCKMGHDAMAVVDDQLRVRGIEGLRVVDASIMPIIPNANINAPTIMIAEKAADLISKVR
jgi:choline dehydrogenase